MTSKCIDGAQVIRQPIAGLLNVTEASASAIKTAVEVIDNAISGNEMQVDVVTMPTITETNSGAIKTAVEILDNAISGNEMQVDVVTMPSVTATVSGTITPDAKTGVVQTTDAQVKATAGIVYGVLVSYVGVTAGDKVELKNSTDNSGTALITIVADGANGTNAFYPCVGITYSTGIYYDVTIADAGSFTATIVYA